MRLIDADAFNDWILSHFTEPQSAFVLTLQGFIAEQPTAYDVDKVVEKLETLRKECEDPLQDYCPDYFIDRAVDFVKGGGVDE